MLDILIGSLDAAVDGQIDSDSFDLLIADLRFSCQCPNAYDMWDRWY